MNNDKVYSMVNDRIIDALKKGVCPWIKPWVSTGKRGLENVAYSHTTGRPYSLINQFMISRAGEYLTFNQCKKEGGHVKKGAKGYTVVFWKFLNIDAKDENGKPIKDENGETVKKTIPYLQYYTVFNIEDCDGIKRKYEKAHGLPEDTADENAETVITEYMKREGITLVRQYGQEAFYRPFDDSVHVPAVEQFTDLSEYYSTIFHELTHSTGHEKRLNRLNGDRFGSNGYSKEELTAEIGSACMLADLGIETEKSFRNSTAYIQSWLSQLTEHTKTDHSFIISAFGKAEKAVRYIYDGKKDEQEQE